jgi:hypothetical protein
MAIMDSVVALSGSYACQCVWQAHHATCLAEFDNFDNI